MPELDEQERNCYCSYLYICGNCFRSNEEDMQDRLTALKKQEEEDDLLL